MIQEKKMLERCAMAMWATNRGLNPAFVEKAWASFPDENQPYDDGQNVGVTEGRNHYRQQARAVIEALMASPSPKELAQMDLAVRRVEIPDDVRLTDAQALNRMFVAMLQSILDEGEEK